MVEDFKDVLCYPFETLSFQLKLELNKFRIDDAGDLYKFDLYDHPNDVSIKDKVNGIPDMTLDYS